MNAMAWVAGAVLNSLWQAAVLTFLVWLVLRFLQPRGNAATRHIVWWIALAAVVVLPLVPRRNPPAQPRQPARPQATAAALPVRIAAPLEPPPGPAPVTITGRRTAVLPFCLLAIWAAVLAQRTVRLVRSYVHLRGVKRRAAAWTRPLPAVTRRASLLISREVSSPIAVGFLHPAAILPETLRHRLTAQEMDCVLLHEAAHLARYDDWVNLAARLLDAALALHPVAWWILRQIEREREMACDDWVVAHTGTARSYARSLARIAELRVEPADSVLSAGIFTRHSRLHRRIEMLLLRGREFSPMAARTPVALAALALAGLAVAGALAPHWVAFAQRPEFEVASVKLNTNNGNMDGFPRRSGDLILMHNTQPYSVIYYAYHLHGAYQMVGYVRLPDGWNWYDIDARVGGDATDDQVRLMFQSLLADRFKLKVHRETREIPEFELVIAKGKSKLTPSSDKPMKLTIEERSFTEPPGTCSATLWREGTHLICHAATMDKIVAQVSGLLSAPVVDRTGLTGTYDLNVLYLPDNRKLDPNAEPGPSLAQAIQEELGLKLEKGKGPVEVIVIDHMEKPSEN